MVTESLETLLGRSTTVTGTMTYIMVKEDLGIRIANNLAVISILGISISWTVFGSAIAGNSGTMPCMG